MQDNTTLARPYAKAAFEYALQHQQLASWADMLQLAGAIVQDKQMASLLADPRYRSEQILQLILDLCKDQLAADAQHGAQHSDAQHIGAQHVDAQHNFLRLLAENQRLMVLAEIAELFLKLQAEHERTVRVEVTSVVELKQEQQAALLQALEQKLNKKINLHFHLDPQILGGISIRAGDKVIDLTLLGQLQQLNAKLRTA